MITRRELMRALWALVACTGAAGLAAVVVVNRVGPSQRWARGLDHLFDLDLEQNWPTFVSSGLLVLVAGLLALVAREVGRRGEPHRRLWLVLAVIFLGLGYDEFGAVHELTIPLFRERFGLGSLAWFGWVVPGAVAVALFALAYLRFLFDLRPAVRRRFVLCAVVYVGAALGLDVVGGPIAVARGESSGLYIASQWVQEVLEMGAMVGFVNALLVQLELVTGGAGATVRLAPTLSRGTGRPEAAASSGPHPHHRAPTRAAAGRPGTGPLDLDQEAGLPVRVR